MKIDLKALKQRLPMQIAFFDCIDSTSLYLKRQITNQADVPDLVIALEQTNGQGRAGKHFYSPGSTGLYLTFAIASSKIPCKNVTSRAALCVSRAIDRVFSCSTKLKWVNDVYLSDKKIAGILCQTVPPFCLIGIGINVEKPSSIPKDLISRFGSITDQCDPRCYEELILSLCEELNAVLKEEKHTVLEEYRHRCNHIGKRVGLEQNGAEIMGVCIGIDDDFSLLLESDGVVRPYRSGVMTLPVEGTK